MTDSNKTNSVEKLLQLQQNFKSKLPSRISDIESSWLAVRDNQDPDFKNLHLLLHSLIGTAGTFGASIVSNYARKLEIFVKALLNNQSELNNTAIQEIDYYSFN